MPPRKKRKKAMAKKVVTRKSSGGRPKVKDAPNLNTYHIFCTFLVCNPDRKFEVTIPYNSPLTDMFNQLTCEMWKADKHTVRGWEDKHFKLPVWAQRYIERLTKYESDNFIKGKEVMIDGKKALELLLNLTTKQRKKKRPTKA